MLQILYTNDHLQRGVALAGEEAGSAHGLINIAPAAKGVTTLLFGGHGDNYGLCTKNATELAEIIKAWGASLIKFQKIGERTVSFRGDIAQRADEMVRLHKGHDRQWTMNYGYFNTLRKNLVVVK